MASEGTRLPYPVLTVLAGAGFTAITTEVLPIGLLPAIGRDLGANDSRTGLLVSAYAVVVAVCAVPAAALLARWPRRRTLTGVMALYVVGNVAMALAPDYGFALGARLLTGLAHAGFFSLMFGTAIVVAPPGKSGRAMALVSAGNAVGFAAGVPLGTAVGLALGWRWAFAACALLMLLWIGAVVFVLPKGQAAPAAGDGVPVLQAARRKPALLAAAMVVALTLGQYTAYTYITPMLLHAGVGERRVSLVLAGYGIAGIVGLVVAAAAVDRLPRLALNITVGLIAACLVVLGTVPAAVPSTVAVAVWGLAFGSLPTLVQQVALLAMPGAGDAVAAIVNATFNIGIAGGAFLGSRELLVAAPPALALTGAALVLGSIGVLALVPRPAPVHRGPSEVDDLLAARR